MRKDDGWCRSLAGQSIGKYRLEEFVGAGNIGYVYRATHRDVPNSKWAVKLVFDVLKEGWGIELWKVSNLGLIDGVVHLHGVDTETVSYQNISHLAQYTVWDYISPGQNLAAYLKKIGTITHRF